MDSGPRLWIFSSFVANPCSHPHLWVPSTLRYKGRRPVSEVLRSLGRAQAEAVTNQLQMAQGVEEIESQVPWRQATVVSAGKKSTWPEPTQFLDYSLGCFKIEGVFPWSLPFVIVQWLCGGWGWWCTTLGNHCQTDFDCNCASKRQSTGPQTTNLVT